MVTPEDHNIRSLSSKQMEMVTKRICKTATKRSKHFVDTVSDGQSAKHNKQAEPVIHPVVYNYNKQHL